MKRNLPMIWACVVVFLLLTLFPSPFFGTTPLKPFTHKETYGKWTKKIVSDGSKTPLYVTFSRDYSPPDEQGNVFDRASLTVMEPPISHDTYEEFSKFMSPANIQQPKNLRLTANPVVSSVMYIGGFQAKIISGTGSLISLDDTMPSMQLLGKGYYLTLPNRVIEVLAQVQTVKGDLGKIEAEIDEFVSSFRFGEAEDLLIIRAIKQIPFQLEPSPVQPASSPKKLQIPWDWIILTGVSLGLILLAWWINRHRGKTAKRKTTPKKRNRR